MLSFQVRSKINIMIVLNLIGLMLLLVDIWVLKMAKICYCKKRNFKLYLRNQLLYLHG